MALFRLVLFTNQIWGLKEQARHKGGLSGYWSLSTWNKEGQGLVATVSWCNQQVARALTFHDM